MNLLLNFNWKYCVSIDKYFNGQLINREELIISPYNRYN